MARRGGLGHQGHAAIGRAVEELHNRRPQGNPAATDAPRAEEQESTPKQWWDFQSSRIAAASYDRDHQTLFVQFVKQNGPGMPGPYYTYEGVSAQEWRNLRRSQSPGKYVNRVLNYKNYHASPGLE
jgi:hypothetical protein